MRSTGSPPRGRTEQSVVRVALTRFAVLALIGLGVLASVTAYMSQSLAQDEAVRDALSRTIGIADGIASPLVDQDVRRGDPDAMRRLDEALRNRMRDGSVSHLVVWDLDGSVIWADVREGLDHDEGLPTALTASESVERVVVDRDDLPGAFVRGGTEEWVEVYVRATDADGRPFIFESYTPRDRLQADTGAVLRELLPLTLGSLVVLVIAIAPLAFSLARRIDRANASRREVLRRSLRSWRNERERLAQSLHDDVIQDLSAMGYALPAVLEALPADSRGRAARATGERMNEVLVDTVRLLRSVLTDLAPSGFEDTTLEQALRELALQPRGLRVDLVIDPDLRTGPAAGILVYRIVREGLHNVTKHADATHVMARVSRGAAGIEVTIDDDGRGPARSSVQDDHMGLRLLQHFLDEGGGRLELVPRQGGGARLRAVVPHSLDELDGDPDD